MARFRQVVCGTAARWAIIAVSALVLISSEVSAVSAEPVKLHGAPMATDLADRYAAEIAEASQRFGIPESWIRAVMRVESGGRVRAVSPKGALGLMQIMPETWAGLRLRHRLGGDPYDLRDNILAGAAYLREMHDRFGATGFLAAYNAGPGRYAEYLNIGRSLPAETLAYVAAVAPLIGGEPLNRNAVIAIGSSAWSNAPLFAVLADNTAPPNRLQVDGRLRARSVSDLSGLEPPHSWQPHDRRRAVSLFVARASDGSSR